MSGSRGNGYDANTHVDYPGGEIPPALAKVQSRVAEPADEDGIKTSSTGLRIAINEDGSVDLDMPSPAIRRSRSEEHFDDNLAETLSDADLQGMVMDYLDGVAMDILSRSQFIANWNRGVDLLGLKIEDPSATRGSRGSISRVKNPALLKACVRSQSLARGQLLPPTGPAKIVEISDASQAQDEIARDFGEDFNYYLTEVAKEYYPDTDRMLFYRAFGGSGYKKVYRCPLRRRPVSDSVQLDSLIVSEDATDLQNAVRKTHESQVPPVTMRRMQLEGGWLDVPLTTPQVTSNQMKRKVLESQGIAAVSTRQQDISHTVYEGYWSIDPADYGIEERNAPEGLPLPYRIVIDKDSQKGLALHRNWKKGDERFQERQVFVKYGLVPGLGFLDYGYLHLIGNQTRVLTAIWQIMIDKGMMANFPAGMKVKGVRTSTNEINPGLGEWVEVDIGAQDDIRKALMGLPYGQGDNSLIELLKIVQEDVESLSGMIEIETGSNRTNVPVGSILAMIEQQSQDLTAVHQRDHRSQKEELNLLRDLFIENPRDLMWMTRKGGRQWIDLVAEFSDMDLVPASDPNVPSQVHRIMLNQLLLEVAKGAPMLFTNHMHDVAVRVLKSSGINDADSLVDSQQEISQTMSQQQGQGKGSGAQSASAQASVAKAQMMLPIEQAKVANDAKRVQLDEAELERQAANEAEEHRQRDAKLQMDTTVAAVKLRQAEDELAADSQPEQLTPIDAADERLKNAQTFAAMGSGAAGFAKAQQTVQQGEAELRNLDASLGDGTQPAAAPLQNTPSKRKTTQPK